MPRRHRLLLAATILAAPAFLAACGRSAAAPEEVIVLPLQQGERQATLYVGSQMTRCSWEGITRCLKVRESTSQPWRAFYGGIEDFTWESGYTYRLSIAIRDIPNPPADGSSAAYRLLEIIEKKRD